MPLDEVLPHIAVSYKFTGIPIETLTINIGALCAAILKKGNPVFCSLNLEDTFKEKGMTAEEIYQYCFDQFKNSDICVAFVDVSEPSSGMVKEISIARERGMPIYLIIRRGLDFADFRACSSRVYEYDNTEEIAAIVDSIEFLN